MKKAIKAAKRRRPFDRTIVLFFMVLFFIAISVGIASQLSMYGKYKQEAEEILVQIQQEQQKNAEYIREKEYYNSDAYIEKVARQQLGLVMPNEILYVNNSKN
ncbi:septum formation initiator family protein [Clostridium sp. MD294]|uniref:FtsB family cell division protein n=1 Tax=Clostridium sp. MD294 TaxID=97138 RepID=UPI0002C9D046|nr:septum formation initiator family protein [Clostridium sp. MD294]NDO46627.1 septum formation initiator family protein [Clostridium sp. MD294]USF28940.1 Cell division protein FtsL [Clostridium sp. MD294]